MTQNENGTVISSLREDQCQPIDVRVYAVAYLPEEEGRKFTVGKTMRVEETITLEDGTTKTTARSMKIEKQTFEDGRCRLELNPISIAS